MNELREVAVQCPYCAETINILIDCSVMEQFYIEDCQVCCRPMNVEVSCDPVEGVSVSVTHEDE